MVLMGEMYYRLHCFIMNVYFVDFFTVKVHVACARLLKEQVKQKHWCFEDHDLLKCVFSNVFFMCMENFQINAVY